ncbi:hypothetical protein AKJ51_01080 [candidate division MSBL1 archaeon SCGC-AAA382A20]|uniref:Uncharacterized protein n=1 Tax=candidate division MSBL1 archaeon SCGC-AAA382A20 TaxID=1698280 RepID=A0A133VM80_9EURY|nr:hypothetical protein AKJ51_01080 [candidate division MSBL1 archaeon SCGC-AAA382A20]
MLSDDLEEKVDFDAVKKEISEGELDIRYIRIIYEGLTEEEIKKLQKQDDRVEVKDKKVIAPYPSDSNPLYQDKATGILYLPA